ncbi:MAG: 2-hydroxyacid dehydrogenase [Roseovarius sp.]|nr:2-hydroxyacid dehydrogenase [Roseovarius sp.]MCY4291836.1 2-hydroxyacid dehydrogenase [Roseovarius sp.]MCY4315809.1 2-hydroxyacid dehydrogenase [Roseovarius sp.]
MKSTIAIGSYSESDGAGLAAEFDPVTVSGPAAMAGLDPQQRSAIRVAAFKGGGLFGGEEMDLLPGLGLIANYGVGYDAIDIDAANARGVKVTNTPDVLNDDVADLAVALLLCLGREMMHAAEWAKSGKWKRHGEYPLNRKVSGGRAGIVGLGRIGREIANRLAAFKMDIHYYSRRQKETPGWTYHDNPITLAERVDYMIIALVGGRETENFVSGEVLEALGPKGLLVNISRGTTVEEEALLDALENGKLGGAALDVFLNEPAIDPRFYKLENVVVQPHQGSGTVETRRAMGELQRANMHAFLAGDDLITPVN